MTTLQETRQAKTEAIAASMAKAGYDNVHVVFHDDRAGTVDLVAIDKRFAGLVERSRDQLLAEATAGLPEEVDADVVRVFGLSPREYELRTRNLRSTSVGREIMRSRCRADITVFSPQDVLNLLDDIETLMARDADRVKVVRPEIPDPA